MNTALVVALWAIALVALVLAAVLLLMLSGRRRLRAELVAARAELAALRDRVDALTPPAPGPAVPALPAAEFVITRLGTGAAEPGELDPPAVSSRAFLSVALGESLVRVVSLGYGVRRALSAENRNRIAFEMRREVRRSRKQRRRDLREARRTLRAEGTAA